eukprot:COSAG01_NODE_1948_length_8825_cov_9.036214_6_plen_154_part_00
MVFAICRSSPPHPAPGWTLEMRFTFAGCTFRRLGILTGPATASLGALLPAGAWRLFIVGHKVDCPSCSAPGGGPRECSQGSSQCETQAGRRRTEIPREMPPPIVRVWGELGTEIPPQFRSRGNFPTSISSRSRSHRLNRSIDLRERVLEPYIT